jgi:hypothetical protein
MSLYIVVLSSDPAEQATQNAITLIQTLVCLSSADIVHRHLLSLRRLTHIASIGRRFGHCVKLIDVSVSVLFTKRPSDSS